MLHSRRLDKIIVVCLFLLWPFLSLPFLLVELYKGRRYAFSLVAVLLGYFALLYAPTGDLYRYFQDYLTYSSLSISEFFMDLKGQMDVFQPTTFYLFSRIGMSADWIRFLYVYLSSELLFSIYCSSVRTNNNYKNFIIFLLLILFVRFERFTVRFGLSTMFFVFGWYKLEYCNQRKYWSFFLLAILNHFAFILPVVAYVVARFIRFKPSKGIFLAILVGTFCLSGDYLSSIISHLPFNESVVNHLLAYTDGYWAADFLDDLSAKYNLGRNLLRLPFYVFSLVLIFQYKKDRVLGTIVMTLILVLLFSPFIKVQSRMEQVYVIQALVYLMNNTDELLKTKKRVYCALALGCMYTFICTWTIRRELSLSHETRLLCPSWVIWKSTYTEDWVDFNVYQDGAPNVNF